MPAFALAAASTTPFDLNGNSILDSDESEVIVEADAVALTDKLGSEASSLIDKIIFVAVPQVGTPQAIGAILHGYDQSLPNVWFLPDFILTSQTARMFASTSPMTYNLLPSSQYFTRVDDPVITFDNDPILAPWRAKYGVEIHSKNVCTTFSQINHEARCP